MTVTGCKLFISFVSGCPEITQRHSSGNQPVRFIAFVIKSSKTELLIHQTRDQTCHYRQLRNILYPDEPV